MAFFLEWFQDSKNDYWLRVWRCGQLRRFSEAEWRTNFFQFFGTTHYSPEDLAHLYHYKGIQQNHSQVAFCALVCFNVDIAVFLIQTLYSPQELFGLQVHEEASSLDEGNFQEEAEDTQIASFSPHSQASQTCIVYSK